MNSKTVERPERETSGAFGYIRAYLRDVALSLRWRKSKGSTVALIAAFGVGVLGLLLATAPSNPLGRWSSLAVALSDAFVVAGVLSLTVDPFVQRKFAEEWGHGIFWAIFNEDAPPALRREVNKIAEVGYYAVRTEWYLTFAWSEDSTPEQRLLDLTCRSDYLVRCVDKHRDKKAPTFTTGIVDRHDGAPSSIIAFEYSGRDDKSVVLTPDQISKCTKVDQTTKVATINPGEFLKDCGMVYKEEATVRTTMRTSVRDIHSIPFFTGGTSLRWKVILEGPAVADLDVHLFGSRSGGLREPAGKRTGSPPNQRVTFKSEEGVVTFPGHGLVLEWQPKREGAKAVATADGL